MNTIERKAEQTHHCGNPLAEQESEAAAKTCMCPEHGNWIAADDYILHVKALDVALNGEVGAQSPKLIDVLAQIESLRLKYGRPILYQIYWMQDQGRSMLDDITAKNMEIVDLRTEIARYKALAGELAEAASAVAELHVLPGESPDVMFERISLLFTRDTGYVSLGKDCRVHDHQTRGDAWNNWVAARVSNLRTAIAKYDSSLKEQQEKGV